MKAIYQKLGNCNVLPTEDSHDQMSWMKMMNWMNRSTFQNFDDLPLHSRIFLKGCGATSTDSLGVGVDFNCIFLRSDNLKKGNLQNANHEMLERLSKRIRKGLSKAKTWMSWIFSFGPGSLARSVVSTRQNEVIVDAHNDAQIACVNMQPVTEQRNFLFTTIKPLATRASCQFHKFCKKKLAVEWSSKYRLFLPLGFEHFQIEKQEH